MKALGGRLLMIAAMLFSLGSQATRKCEISLEGLRLLSDDSMNRERHSELYRLAFDTQLSLGGDRAETVLRIHKNLKRMTELLNLLGFPANYDPLRREIEFLPDSTNNMGAWVVSMRNFAEELGVRNDRFKLKYAPEEEYREKTYGSFHPETLEVKIGSEVLSSLLRSSRGLGYANLRHEIRGHVGNYLLFASGKSKRLYGTLFLEGSESKKLGFREDSSYRDSISLDEPLAQEESAMAFVESGDYSAAEDRLSFAVTLADLVRSKLAEDRDGRGQRKEFRFQILASPKKEMPKEEYRKLITKEIREINEDIERFEELRVWIFHWGRHAEELRRRLLDKRRAVHGSLEGRSAMQRADRRIYAYLANPSANFDETDADIENLRSFHYLLVTLRAQHQARDRIALENLLRSLRQEWGLP